jgi:hypothetical protein
MNSLFKRFTKITPTLNSEYSLSQEENRTIIKFAKGDQALRGAAVDAFHRVLRAGGSARSTLAMRFMAEVNHAVPDINLRGSLRSQLLQEDQRKTAQPVPKF